MIELMLNMIECPQAQFINFVWIDIVTKAILQKSCCEFQVLIIKKKKHQRWPW